MEAKENLSVPLLLQLIYIFNLKGLKVGYASPPPYRGEGENFLVGHSKALSNIGLNVKNEIPTSNNISIVEILIFTVYG